ncbi:MAG TPA: DUF6544 family protein [Gemmatimonadaceae bacterium]|jgi:hypothetical protein|nr:DUF6544 family protein [Gemmatimonadaceae bacterium]
MILGATVAVVLAGITLALASSAIAWRRSSRQLVSQLLLETAQPPERGVMEEPALVPADLPAPVARYFAFALPSKPVRIRTAQIRWTGEFRMRPGGGWRPFEAEQNFTASPPGFVWDAQIRMMPLVPVRVRDSYIAGGGAMLGRVGGLMTVVNEGGTPEMAASALTRWLGEAVWFPTALLPGAARSEGVRWTAIDDSTARATVSDGRNTASADFHFAPSGEVTGMTALRYRDVNGTGVLTPFEGQYRDYSRRNGVMVPMSSEVAWLLPEGRFAYWRGRPLEVKYSGERH